MALDKLIPRIEWNEISIVGDTHSNTTVDGIADTTDIIEGMIVSGSGITAGTTVISKTTNAFVLSVAASSTLNDTTLTLIQRFDFDYPPMVDTGEKITNQGKESRSLSGLSQVQTNWTEFQRDITCGFLTEAQKDSLRNLFFVAWAVFGNEFDYYYDKNDSTVVTYSLKDRRMDFKRQVKKHPYFLYETKLTMKRVV
jgi:hypothetical protein